MRLEAQALAVGYRDRVVGRGFSLALEGGEVLALLGPNGGGKTTLLKTLLGLLPPLEGAVILDGADLAGMPVRARAKRLAFVPQIHVGTFAFSVEEVVLMGRSAWGSVFTPPSRRDREVTRTALARLGIAHLAGRPYTRISGGERQLALIARALAQEPRAILLDEPTASLDFGNQGRVLREIHGLARAGLAVMFTTHDPNHALRFADRALLVRDGGTLAQGPAQELIERVRLAELYGTEVEELTDAATGYRGYLPA